MLIYAFMQCFHYVFIVGQIGESCLNTFLLLNMFIYIDYGHFSFNEHFLLNGHFSFKRSILALRKIKDGVVMIDELNTLKPSK